VSGYAQHDVVEQGTAISTSAFLQKPVSPDVLVKKVRAMLDTPSSADVASTEEP